MAPSACTDTCTSAEASCGSVCGQTCGECDGGKVCLAGKCTAAVDVGCPECSLRLSLVDKQSAGGDIKHVTIALDYYPKDSEPKPRLADFRFKANHDITIVSVQPGDALVQAGKALFTDPLTGKPWRKRSDGTYQIAALSAENTNRFASGRIFTVAIDLSAPSAAFFLRKRELTFAPLEADQALQASSYENPVVVVP